MMPTLICISSSTSRFVFLSQPDVGDLHLLIDRFAHVVDRQQRERDAGQRLHLHAGLRGGARGAFHFHGVFDRRDVDVDVAQVQTVAKRDQLRRLLRRLDAGDPRGREDIPLRDLVLGNQRQRLRAAR